MADMEADLSRLMNDCAESMIRKHKLRNQHGDVACWNCHGRPATMPSLHCVQCLAEHRAGKLKRTPNPEDDGR